MTMASAAGRKGATSRWLSRPSRSRISCRTLSHIAGLPRCRNSSKRRRARASSVAVTNSLTSAWGQTTVPVSRPSRMAPRPPGGRGRRGWRDRARAPPLPPRSDPRDLPRP
jgi:hypothetical protein